MLLLFVAVLVSFLAASVAANFAVIFTVVDQAITTTTTSTGLLEVKGTGAIAKTATATQDVPLLIAPVLDLDTLSQVQTLKIKYAEQGDDSKMVETHTSIVAVRKHNATFVEFVTDVPGEIVEVLNGLASLVRHPTDVNGLRDAAREVICSANATCSAFQASGIDVEAALELAKAELLEAGISDAARRLQWMQGSCPGGGSWTLVHHCGYQYGPGYGEWNIVGGQCYGGTYDDVANYYGAPSPHYGAAPPGAAHLSSFWYTGTYNYARHIVFFAHGKGMGAHDMWDEYCTPGTSACPAITGPPSAPYTQYRHLVFVFGGMGIWDANFNSHGWSRDIDYSDYAEAMAALAHSTSGFRAVIESDLGDVFKWNTKILWVGYSDGGGMGMYLQYFGGLNHIPQSGSFQDSDGMAGITQVIAIDYYANQYYTNWLTGTGFKMNAKIYASCKSFTFSHGAMLFDDPASQCPNGTPPSGCEPEAMPQKMFGNGYYFQHYTSENYDNTAYKEWKWNKVQGRPKCGSIKWAVTGLTNPLPEGYTTGHNEWTGQCPSGPSHTAMLGLADVFGDIDNWIRPPTWGIKFNPCHMAIAAVTTKALTSGGSRLGGEWKATRGNDDRRGDRRLSHETARGAFMGVAMEYEARTWEPMSKYPCSRGGCSPPPFLVAPISDSLAVKQAGAEFRANMKAPPEDRDIGSDPVPYCAVLARSIPKDEYSYTNERDVTDGELFDAICSTI